MLFAGRGREYWVDLLASRRLALRLMAVRALSELGAVEDLLEVRLDHPIRAWALARAGEFPRNRAPLAFFLRARARRSVPASGPSLERCLAGLRSSLHPHACFAWAFRLVELYGSDAIPGLMDVLLHRVGRRPEPYEAASWALGQLGIPVVRELRQALTSQPSRGTLFWVCQTAWYLGPTAAPLGDLLEKFLPDPGADAALLAVGRSPLWLDEENVSWLAEHLFGFEPARRVEAARALGGFGPALALAPGVLGQFVLDADAQVQAAVVRSLLRHGEEGLGHLLPLVTDPAIRERCERLSGLTHLVRVGLAHASVAMRRGAAELARRSMARELPLSDWTALLESPDPVVRRKVAWMLSELPQARAVLIPLLLDPDPEVRLLVATAFRQAPELLRELLEDPDPFVSLMAATGLLESGTAEDARRILQVNTGPALTRCLSEMQKLPPGLRDALGDLKHPEHLLALRRFLTSEHEPALFGVLGAHPELDRLWTELAPFWRLPGLFASENAPMRRLAACAARRFPERACEVPIEDPDPAVSEALVDSLVQLVRPGLPCLGAWARASSDRLAGAALRVIRGSLHPELLEAVGRALDRPRLGAEAAEALSCLPGWRRGRPLGELIGLTRDFHEGWAQLSDGSREELVALLRSWLEDGRPALSVAALGLLNLLWGEREAEELLAAVRPSLRHPDPEVLEAALRCLAGAPPPLAIPLVRPLLDEGSIGLTALEVLAELGAWEELEPLWFEPWSHAAVCAALLAHRRLPGAILDGLRAGRMLSAYSLLLAHSLLPTEAERSVLREAFLQADESGRRIWVSAVSAYGTTGHEVLLELLPAVPEAGPALSQLLTHSVGSLEWLLSHLGDLPLEDPSLVHTLSGLLREVGTYRARDLVERIRPLATSLHPDLAEAALFALARAGDEQALLSALASEPTRALAVRALKEMPWGRLGTEFLARLRALDSSPEVQSTLDRLLLLTDEDLLEYVRAGNALSRRGPLHPERLERLFELGDAAVRSEIAESLREPLEHLPVVIAGLCDEEESVRREFSRVLARELGTQELPELGEPARLPLRAALAHRWPAVRRGAAEALGVACDLPSEGALRDLAENDPDPEVRSAALGALHNCWVSLPQSLVSCPPEILRVGLERAQLLWSELDAHRLVSVLEPVLEHFDPDIRRQAVLALAAGPVDRVGPLLERALEDGELMALAANALSALGRITLLEPQWREFWASLAAHGHLPAEVKARVAAGQESSREALALCRAGLALPDLIDLLSEGYARSPDPDALVRGPGLAILEVLWRRRAWKVLRARLPSEPSALEWLLARHDELPEELREAALGLLDGASAARAYELSPALAELLGGPLELPARAALERSLPIVGLVSQLMSGSCEQRLAAVLALGEVTSSGSIGWIMRHCAECDIDRRVRLAAGRVASRFLARAGPGATPPEMAYLLTLRPGLWPCAPREAQLEARLLARASHPELLILGLESPDREIRFAYAERLVSLGIFLHEAVPVFLEKGLGKLLVPVALDDIRAAVAHPNAAVARSARAILRDVEE